MKNQFILLSTLVILLLTACRKDSEIITIEQEEPIIEVNVETHIIGFVNDRTGQAIPQAIVSLGNVSITTDENGYFKIKNLTNSNKAVISVESAGYFTNYQTLIPNKPGAVRTNVQLTPKVLTASLSSDAGGIVPINNNSTVEFAPNSFVHQNGNPYNGMVNLYTSYIDPTDPEILSIMPGNLTAVNVEGEQQLLTSYGMVNVEIEGTNGEVLQINQPAALSIAVPESLTNAAPTTIPMWFFDTTIGQWIEEGAATLQNGIYSTQVAHFTFWNCDVPNDYVNLKGKIIFDKYEVLAQVRITNLSNNESRTTTINTDGTFAGAVPSQEALVLEVISDCGTVLKRQDIAPLTSDSNLGDIELELGSNDVIVILGLVTDCDDVPVSNGYVLLDQGELGKTSLTLNETGTFEAVIFNCQLSQIELTAFDIENLTSGTPQTFAAAPVINSDVLKACGETLDVGLFMNFNGTDIFIDNVSAKYEQGITTFNVTDETSTGSIVYEISFIDFNQGQGNPIWALASNYAVIDNPNRIYEIAASENDIIQTVSGVNTGEYVRFEIAIANVDEVVSGQTDAQATVILAANIQ